MELGCCGVAGVSDGHTLGFKVFLKYIDAMINNGGARTMRDKSPDSGEDTEGNYVKRRSLVAVRKAGRDLWLFLVERHNG